jgi:hypothetical protein
MSNYEAHQFDPNAILKTFWTNRLNLTPEDWVVTDGKGWGGHTIAIFADEEQALEYINLKQQLADAQQAMEEAAAREAALRDYLSFYAEPANWELKFTSDGLRSEVLKNNWRLAKQGLTCHPPSPLAAKYQAAVELAEAVEIAPNFSTVGDGRPYVVGGQEAVKALQSYQAAAQAVEGEKGDGN